MAIKLVFLISLPRSGSTLLQRYLSTQPEIATSPEPWIALPQAFLLKGHGIKSLYGHGQETCNKAIADFISDLPAGTKDYEECLRDFLASVYEKAARGQSWFLDKTPRYYLIIPELMRLFPEAKFIFLFRNPLAVLASIMRTWSNGGFRRLHKYRVDLYEGVKLLAEARIKFAGRYLAVAYEDFLQYPDRTLQSIFNYLCISPLRDLSINALYKFAQGRMGDQTGIAQYKKIDPTAQDKWKLNFNTHYRIAFAKHYLEQLGSETLYKFGYSKQDLLGALSSIDAKWSPAIRDRAERVYDFVNLCMTITLDEFIMSRRNRITIYQNS